MKEKIFNEKVWVSSLNPFRFTEQIDPKTGQKRYILKGLMLPFDKISRNNVLYNRESVIKKHKDLIGRPLMYNHQVEGNGLPFGHFVDSWLEDDGWHYSADIDPNETDMIRKLERGDLRHVSIQLIGGRVVERFDESNRAYTEAYVSDVIEGSIVPCPGFLDTTAKLAEAFKSKEDISTSTVKGAISPAKLADEEMKEQADPKDSVSFDVPLLIRLFEYFNETQVEDKDLHFIVDSILSLSKEKPVLNMDDYDAIINSNSEIDKELEKELDEMLEK